jgi:hypothetical protein
VPGFCEHGDEPSRFHKESRIFFDKLGDSQLLKNILHHGVSVREGML